MQITSYGAAGEVTGSQHLLETDTHCLLLDCGLFQGSADSVRLRNEFLSYGASRIDGVVLSHAHIDHCGNLPLLYRAGFRGPIFCSEPTGQLVEIMLRDSVRLRSEQRGDDHWRDEDRIIRELVRQMRPLAIDQWHELSRHAQIRLSLAGHILGATISQLRLEDEFEEVRVVYSGDLGPRGARTVPDPTSMGGCDVLLCESTYADRVHGPLERASRDVVALIERTLETGGRLIIPAFSLGRTQQLLSLLFELWSAHRIPAIPVYLDSPLSLRVLQVYREYAELDSPFLRAAGCLGLDYPELICTPTPQESQAINGVNGPIIILSASGMCEGGRVLHHLRRTLPDAANAVLLPGYQARDTLGRQLADGSPAVRIHEGDVPVEAHVVQLSALSAHADALDLQWWLGEMGADEGIGQLIAVHGEERGLQALCALGDEFCNERPQVAAAGVPIRV